MSDVNMIKKRHVIITSVDDKCGEFLCNHWLRSLKDNVVLANIDVVVLDFGLGDDHKAALLSEGAIIEPVNIQGNVMNTRYLALTDFLRKNNYDQVLLVDGGDLIFQRDISRLFEENKESIRLVSHKHKTFYYELVIGTAFPANKWIDIYKVVSRQPMYNGGFLLGSREKIVCLVSEVVEMINNWRVYGADQVALNYCVGKHGVVDIDDTYNYTAIAGVEKIVVKEGRVYDGNERLVHVVHNAGRNLRPFDSFGYGKKFNKVNNTATTVRGLIHKIARMVKRGV